MNCVCRNIVFSMYEILGLICCVSVLRVINFYSHIVRDGIKEENNFKKYLF